MSDEATTQAEATSQPVSVSPSAETQHVHAAPRPPSIHDQLTNCHASLLRNVANALQDKRATVEIVNLAPQADGSYSGTVSFKVQAPQG